jgi:ergothioneine biosynthesis protein EgtB
VTLPPRLPTVAAQGGRVTVPAGRVTLGTGDEAPFAWDNERPSTAVSIDAFEVDTLNVTNADFMCFVDAGGYTEPQWWRDEDWAWIRQERIAHPSFWERQGGDWYWLAMFERVPLPPQWPVYVTWAEASAYARWRGGRLMTEAEFIRAAEGSAPVNDNFARFDPIAVGSEGGLSRHGIYDLVGNGWEWTADVFAPFDGFLPLPSYPEYSAEFFDGGHFVMKGASPTTARGLVRPGFRNWFRPRYPYVYATFRCVKDA